MSSRAAAESPKAPTSPRSKRPTCYSCRVRKVKCETKPATSKDGSDVSSKCVQCQRLGFQCQWRAPEPGERYDPPPKRRRTIGQRRRLSGANGVEAASATGGRGPRIERCDEESRSETAGGDGVESRPGEASSVPDQPPWLPSDYLGDLALDFDYGYDFLDLNLGEGGFDFIPLPTVDPSIVQLSESTRSIPFQQGAQSGLAFGQDSSAEYTDNSVAPSINDDNRHLIQHYLEVLKGYSKVHDRSKDASNVFISAFTQSLSFPPLFYAILGFSASHLSMKEPSYAEQARKFELLAEASFSAFKQSHGSEIEGFLSALFVRIKTIHVMGGNVDSFFGMITEVVDIISTQQGERALEDPSSLSRNIVLRLALLDSRAGCFRLGGGALVDRLRQSRTLSFIFDFDAPFARPPEAAISLLRADILRKEVGDFDLQLHRQSVAEFIVSPPIRTEKVNSLYRTIEREIARCEREMAGQGDLNTPAGKALDSQTYNYYTISSALHSALVYLYQVFPMPCVHPDTSISKILHCQLKIHRDPSRANSPSSILPVSLFMAGLATADPIHLDWVLGIFEKGQVWGMYIRKTRKVLEALRGIQPQGTAVDVCSAMDRVTGRFII